jgi:hypothetical protein
MGSMSSGHRMPQRLNPVRYQTKAECARLNLTEHGEVVKKGFGRVAGTLSLSEPHWSQLLRNLYYAQNPSTPSDKVST